MWPLSVVVESPGFDDLARIGQAVEPMAAEEYIPETTLEARYERLPFLVARLVEPECGSEVVGLSAQKGADKFSPLSRVISAGWQYR